MNAADITKLVSRLRFKIQPERRKFQHKLGRMGQLDQMSDYVTAMIKYERVEMYYPRADEVRGYTERVSGNRVNQKFNIQLVHFSFNQFFYVHFQLISEAVRHGDQHAPTMAMADFWIKEKQYVHKLFKVIVPRLQNCPISYTKMYKVPITYPDLAYRQRAVLELRGNPFPALKPQLGVNRNFIHNVLLDEAKKEYRRKKYAQLEAESVAASETATKSTKDVDNVTEQLDATSIDEKKAGTGDNDKVAKDSNQKSSNKTK